MQNQFLLLGKAAGVAVPQSKASLQWIAYWRDFNGVEKFGGIVRVGGRLYVNPEKFLAWMATGPTISPPGLKKPKAVSDRAA